MSYLAGHGFEPIGTDVSAGADVVGSVVDASFVNEKLAALDFEAIVHLAGIADLKKTLEDPYSCYQVNCFGTLNALELAAKKKVKRFHYASSANVYGAPKVNPVTEETAMDPRVPYDYSKVVGESLVASYHKTKGVPVAITRAWLLFGEFDHPSRAVQRSFFCWGTGSVAYCYMAKVMALSILFYTAVPVLIFFAADRAFEGNWSGVLGFLLDAAGCALLARMITWASRNL